jgi:hypothetical protein
VVAIVERWAEQAPGEAAAWVAQFPQAPASIAAAQNLVELWGMRDALAVGRWIASLPPGFLREAALSAATPTAIQNEF